MMFSKKNKRKIIINGYAYYWSSTGDDSWINLYVMTEVPSSPKLICYFEYHNDQETFEHKGIKGAHLTNQFVITPYIVRQAIEYGLANGWEPFTRGKDLYLGHIDHKIDLRLEQNKEKIIKSKRKSALGG